MGILSLPTELRWKISDELAELRDRRNLSLTCKSLYTSIDPKCYDIAVRDHLPLLAWAYDCPSPFSGRVDAAKKYLRAGGGLIYDTEWKKHDLVETREIFDHDEKFLEGKLGARHDNTIFAEGMLSEIGRVIAQISKPRGCPIDNQKGRLQWLELVLDNSTSAVLAEVEWQLLRCWICRHFDDYSNATPDLFNTIMGHVSSEAEIPALGAIPKTAMMYQPSEHVDLLAGHEPADLTWALTATSISSHPDDSTFSSQGTARQWQYFYRSLCPLTHFVLGRWNPSQTSEEFLHYPHCRSPRASFVLYLLQQGWTFVENQTVQLLITLTAIQPASLDCFDQSPGMILKLLCKAYSDIHQLNDVDASWDWIGYTGDLTDVQGKFSCQYMVVDSAKSESVATWLGGTVLPWACREKQIWAVYDLIKCMGADVNARGLDGKTAVMHAWGLANIFTNFLDQEQLDLNIRDNDGHSNVLCSIIALGVRLRAEWESTGPRCLDIRQYEESQEKCFVHIKRIIRHSNQDVVNIPPKRGAPPPLWFAMGGAVGRPWYPVLRILLKAGADPNVQAPIRVLNTEYDTWLLHIAAFRTRSQTEKEVVKLLLKHGARAKARDIHGRTAEELGDIVRQ